MPKAFAEAFTEIYTEEYDRYGILDLNPLLENDPEPGWGSYLMTRDQSFWKDVFYGMFQSMATARGTLLKADLLALTAERIDVGTPPLPFPGRSYFWWNAPEASPSAKSVYGRYFAAYEDPPSAGAPAGTLARIRVWRDNTLIQTIEEPTAPPGGSAGGVSLAMHPKASWLVAFIKGANVGLNDVHKLYVFRAV